VLGREGMRESQGEGVKEGQGWRVQGRARGGGCKGEPGGEGARESQGGRVQGRARGGGCKGEPGRKGGHKGEPSHPPSLPDPPSRTQRGREGAREGQGERAREGEI
jgi:hypothetical protein